MVAQNFITSEKITNANKNENIEMNNKMITGCKNANTNRKHLLAYNTPNVKKIMNGIAFGNPPTTS